MEFQIGETVYCHDEGISSPLRRGETYTIEAIDNNHVALSGMSGLYLASRFSHVRPLLTVEHVREVLRKYKADSEAKPLRVDSPIDQTIQWGKQFAAMEICQLLTGMELDDSATLQTG